MTKKDLVVLPDVQSSEDRRNLPIQRVGIKGVEAPVLVKSLGGSQHTVANVEFSVSLPGDKKGTHMSRFWTLLEGIDEPLAPVMMVGLMKDMLASLRANGGNIRFEFPFFIEKAAPISGMKSTMNYKVVLMADADNGKIVVTQKVTAPVTSLCPCSKEISKYGAHNQRSHLSVKAELESNYPIEKQVALIENCASCPVWGMLKRTDEKYVTERAYENPKFVEDLVRDVAISCIDEPAILAFKVEAENFESIHNHSAFAIIKYDKRTHS